MLVRAVDWDTGKRRVTYYGIREEFNPDTGSRHYSSTVLTSDVRWSDLLPIIPRAGIDIPKEALRRLRIRDLQQDRGSVTDGAVPNA